MKERVKCLYCGKLKEEHKMMRTETKGGKYYAFVCDAYCHADYYEGIKKSLDGESK